MGNMFSSKRKTKLVLYWSCVEYVPRVCSEGSKALQIRSIKLIINRFQTAYYCYDNILVKLKQNFNIITVTLFLNVLNKNNILTLLLLF